jgi:hypothetical protein
MRRLFHMRTQGEALCRGDDHVVDHSDAPPGERNAPFALRIIEQHGTDQTKRSRFGKHARQDGDSDTGGHQFKDEVSLTASGFEPSSFFRSDISDIVDLASLKGFPVVIKTGGQIFTNSGRVG